MDAYGTQRVSGRQDDAAFRVSLQLPRAKAARQPAVTIGARAMKVTAKGATVFRREAEGLDGEVKRDAKIPVLTAY